VTDHLILYGIGSPLVAEVEESAHRAGIAVAAGIRNVGGDDHLAEGTPAYPPGGVPDGLRALPYLVPLFTPGHRQAAAAEAARLGFAKAATLIDPTAVLPRAFTAGEGSYVNAGCVFGTGCVFGPFALINRGANIGHHARFGRFVSVGPGAVIAGGVTVGDGAVIGSGAVLLPGVSVGANAVVGAGAVVARAVDPATLVLGNPARVVRRSGGHNGVSVA
jgi:hypothetical protein